MVKFLGIINVWAIRFLIGLMGSFVSGMHVMSGAIVIISVMINGMTILHHPTQEISLSVLTFCLIKHNALLP